MVIEAVRLALGKALSSSSLAAKVVLVAGPACLASGEEDE